jgi:cyclopropane-fatty-acyl-phospholipid synthase
MRTPIDLAEAGRVPDPLLRLAIQQLVRLRLHQEGQREARSVGGFSNAFVATLKQSPIALVPDAANQQHYEVPAEFFTHVLGAHRKYSCGLWPDGVNELDASEVAMLDLTCARAALEDGQQILELGCGWGSLTLFMAQRFPSSRVLAISNSASQRAFIEAEARARGLRNVEVQTADINVFETERRFDRVVSVEMFEHLRNYERLLARIASWLEPSGRLFVHVFAHRHFAYPFEDEGGTDWMARHFFTGGLMPSEDLLLHFQRDLVLEQRWRVSGQHYERTSNAWLSKLDAHRAEVMPVLARTYGAAEAPRWFHRWRLFFLGCAELFGFGAGAEWGVAHYRFTKREARDA